ncbi:hypothetical protein C2S53_019994 [Perilla frutescens var. hirtella]|uniref:Uncharacterized protein n=1 Tax=Perilla frutescens var. hirtella TaxID=608512 RepID=A0AAD4P6T2_PERFH|nr:hypothetical protein C2S53_019994 [Perilla frutescens var. hirtella]
MARDEEQWIIEVNREMMKSGDTSCSSSSWSWSWVSKVNNQVNKLSETRSAESKRWQTQSIYWIPGTVKELCSSSTTSYHPQMVSIGPYHHGNPHLEAMEDHKHRALLNFLQRSKTPLHSYVKALLPVAKDFMEAYGRSPQNEMKDIEAFLQMMILDGCFILEIMRMSTATPEGLVEMGYAANDPVFSNHGKLCFVPYLKRDMLMLENQLPLQVLVLLLLVEDGALMLDDLSKQDHLTALILKFFSQPHEMGNIKDYSGCLHILDLYRKSLLLDPCRKRKQKERTCDSDCLPGRGINKGDVVYIGSATELMEAGIRLKPSKTKNLNDITFEGGVLKLPVVVVDDALESGYLNLMAFERFHVGAGNDVTSYVFFMDKLIDSAKDVSLLQSCGILQNSLGSDKAVARLFNSLSRDVSLDSDSWLGVVHKMVSDYCEMPVPRWMAYAKHNYFTNPWVGMSIVAAIWLFALTGIQTFYTVLSYYHPS